MPNITDIGLDTETGDLGELEGDLPVVQEGDCRAQYIRQKLKLWLAEWFLAESAGVPFHDEVFIKNPRLLVLDAYFKDLILAVPGIVELTRFNMNLDGPTRTLFVDFECRDELNNIISIAEDIGPGIINPYPDTGGGVSGESVLATFTNTDEVTVNVSAFGFNAQRCDVELLDADNDFRRVTDAFTITSPSENVIVITAGSVLTSKNLRVLITPVGE